MARFTSKLTLVLGLCAAVTLALVEHPAGVVSVSTIPGQHLIDHVLWHSVNGYIPRLFIPTTEFQKVYEGQEIIPGLHVKFGYFGFQKFARLIDPTVADNEDTKTPATSHLLQACGSVKDGNSVDYPSSDTTDHEQLEECSRMELQDAFDSITDFSKIEDTDSQQQQQQQQQQPIVPVSAQQQFFLDQLEIVKNSSDHETILGALEELQDLASDMGFGLQLSTVQKLNILVSRLCCGGKTDIDCDKTRLIRSKVALVIGTAVQNHEEAQSTAFKANLHESLMDRLETEPDQQVLRNLIFAYGSLVRGGHSRFIQDEDIVRLAKIYKESTDPEFRRKCVYIMSDFTDPDMQFVSPELNLELVASDCSCCTIVTWPGFRVHDLGYREKENITLLTTAERVKVDVGPWCEILRQETRTNNEDREIIEHAIELLHASYPETCLR